MPRQPSDIVIDDQITSPSDALANEAWRSWGQGMMEGSMSRRDAKAYTNCPEVIADDGVEKSTIIQPRRPDALALLPQPTVHDFTELNTSAEDTLSCLRQHSGVTMEGGDRARVGEVLSGNRKCANDPEIRHPGVTIIEPRRDASGGASMDRESPVVTVSTASTPTWDRVQGAKG